jgi:tetratricopeptide (TPR) repeat protein
MLKLIIKKGLSIYFFVLFLFVSATRLYAQADLPANGNNPRASIMEEVGITSITLKYSRPDVNQREGKIFGPGNLINYGFSTINLETNQFTSPWRAGANEATTIQLEHDVKIEGKELKAGIYALFIALQAQEATLIFSKQTDAWGSLFYTEKDDVLRIIVKPTVLDKSVEWLKYEFIEHAEKHCVIALQWEKISIPFKIEVDVDNIVVQSLRSQFLGIKSFNSTNLLLASAWCFNKNINIEEAITWAKAAVYGINGQRSFNSLANLALGYEKLNKTTVVDSIMDEALGLATLNQWVGYINKLSRNKRAAKALEYLKVKAQPFGNVFAINNAFMQAYSSLADFKKALAYAQKALPQAPNANTKSFIEKSIITLQSNKPLF